MLYPILAFTGSGEADSLAVGRGRHSEGGTRKRDRNIITKAEKGHIKTLEVSVQGQ